MNPGSKAAEKVREGDLISSINGKETLNLSNQVNQIRIIHQQNEEMYIENDKCHGGKCCVILYIVTSCTRINVI